MPTRRFVVTGRVQGVGFRAFVSRCAIELGISGAVWNTREGSVEGIASHKSMAILASFEDRLRDGPGFVDRVEAAPFGDSEQSPGFEIKPTV